MPPSPRAPDRCPAPRFRARARALALVGRTPDAEAPEGRADVDPADGKVHVRFAIAPVLQNPGHADHQQPYFWVQLRNVTSGTTLFQTFNFANQVGVPWKNDSGGTVQYTDWKTFDIAPGPASLGVGDQVELRVVDAGCSHSGQVLPRAASGYGTPSSRAPRSSSPRASPRGAAWPRGREPS